MSIIHLPLSSKEFDFCLIDADLYPQLSQYSWSVDKAHGGTHTHYVRTRPYKNGKRECIFLHREVLRLRGLDPTGFEVDHINHDGLDNRTVNLRLATKTQNRRNRVKQRNSNSRFKGVHKIDNGWIARIGGKANRIYLGYFSSEIDAAMAYNEAALRLFGEFAVINEIQGGDATNAS